MTTRKPRIFGLPRVDDEESPETPRREFIPAVTINEVDKKVDACINEVRTLVMQHNDLVSRISAVRSEQELLRTDVDTNINRLSDVIMKEVIPLHYGLNRLREDLNLAKDERLRDSKVTEDLALGLVHVAKVHADTTKLEAEKSRDNWKVVRKFLVHTVLPVAVAAAVLLAAMIKACG